jgi:excinuclease ABC subunit C
VSAVSDQALHGAVRGWVDDGAYAEDVRNAELFLLGRDDEVLESSSNACRMQRRRSTIRGRGHIPRSSTRLACGCGTSNLSAATRRATSISVAIAAESGLLAVNLVTVRAGQHRGDKSFFPEHGEGYDEPQALEAFIGQHYLNREVPALILVNRQIDAQPLEQLLSAQAGHTVQIALAQAGERRCMALDGRI